MYVCVCVWCVCLDILEILNLSKTACISVLKCNPKDFYTVNNNKSNNKSKTKQE